MVTTPRRSCPLVVCIAIRVPASNLTNRRGDKPLRYNPFEKPAAPAQCRGRRLGGQGLLVGLLPLFGGLGATAR